MTARPGPLALVGCAGAVAAAAALADVLLLPRGSSGTAAVGWLPFVGLMGAHAAILAAFALWIRATVPQRLPAALPGGLAILFLPALPLLLLVARSATLVFRGGWMRQFGFGGIGPGVLLVVSTVGLLSGADLVRRAARSRMRRPAGLALLLVAAAMAGVDATAQRGRYLHLHELALALSSATALAGVLLLLPPRRVAATRGAWAMAIAATAGGLGCVAFLHATWGEVAPRTRRVLTEDLRAGSSLVRLLRLPDASEVLPTPTATELSPGMLRHGRLRVQARKRARASRGGPAGFPSILMISVDALRADACTFHGYPQPTTPFLNELASSCFVFATAHAPSASSYASIASMLSGAYPTTVHDLKGRDPALLSRHLQSAGYATSASFSPNIFTTRDVSWPTGDASLGFARTARHHVARHGVDQILTWLDEKEAGQRPFFIWSHFMDPHYPYRPNPAARFGGEVRDLYDGEIARVDTELRRLFGELKGRGLLDDLVLVITADHGEEFREHGQTYHGGNLYETQAAVPLLIRVPWLAAPEEQISGAVSNQSIPVTLTDLAGLGDPPGNEARSLLPLMLGLEEAEAQVAVAELPVPSQFVGRSPLRAVWKGRRKMIHNLKVGAREFYDLEDDPRELDDRQDAPWCDELVAAERAWFSDLVVGRRQRAGHRMLPDGFLQETMALEAGQLENVVPYLRWLRHDRQDVRHRAADVLLRLWCVNALSNPPNALARPDGGAWDDPYLRGAAETLAALRGDGPIDDGFVEFLGRAPPDVGRAIAKALLLRSSTLKAVAALRKPLLDGRLVSFELEVSALLALHGDPVRVPWLLRAAASRRGVERAIVLNALVALDDSAVWEQLVALARRSDSGWRRSLAAQLRPAVVDAHRDWLRARWAEKDQTLRITALDRLSVSSDGQPEPLLIAALLHDPVGLVRSEAARFLSRQTKPPVHALLRAFGAHDDSARDLVPSVIDAVRPRGVERVGMGSVVIPPHGQGQTLEIGPQDLRRILGAARSYRIGGVAVRRDGSNNEGGRLLVSWGSTGPAPVLRPLEQRKEVWQVRAPKGAGRLPLRVRVEGSAWRIAGLVMAVVTPSPALWPGPDLDAGAPYVTDRLSSAFSADGEGGLWLCRPAGEYTVWGGAATPRRVRLEASMAPGAPSPSLSLNGQSLQVTRADDHSWLFALPPKTWLVSSINRMTCGVPSGTPPLPDGPEGARLRIHALRFE